MCAQPFSSCSPTSSPYPYAVVRYGFRCTVAVDRSQPTTAIAPIPHCFEAPDVPQLTDHEQLQPGTDNRVWLIVHRGADGGVREELCLELVTAKRKPRAENPGFMEPWVNWGDWDHDDHTYLLRVR